MINLSKRNVFALFVLFLVCIVSGCSSVHQTNKQDDLSMKPMNIEDQWGIKVVGVRPTAAGYMLDFRYKIIDPDKASSLVSPTAKPYVIDQKTGETLSVPSLAKIGALKQRGKVAYPDKTYFILFSNPGGFIKSGDIVSVVIGDFKAENIVVE